MGYVFKIIHDMPQNTGSKQDGVTYLRTWEYKFYKHEISNLETYQNIFFTNTNFIDTYSMPIYYEVME